MAQMSATAWGGSQQGRFGARIAEVTGMRLADAVEAAWSVLRAPDVDIGAGPWLARHAGWHRGAALRAGSAPPLGLTTPGAIVPVMGKVHLEAHVALTPHATALREQAQRIPEMLAARIGFDATKGAGLHDVTTSPVVRLQALVRQRRPRQSFQHQPSS